MENRSNTGYPHIDKPWMQYYGKDAVYTSLPQMNLTEYLKMKNEGRMNLVAETYYGKKTTYDELFAKADLAATILSELGVKKGEVVMSLMPNIPEAGYLWLGATQIGAISDFVDPRPDNISAKANADKVLELVKSEKAKYIVALDQCYLGMLRPIEKELKEIGIEKVIIVSASDAMNLQGKIDYLKDVINYNAIKNMRDMKAQDRKKMAQDEKDNVKRLKWYEVALEQIQNMQKLDKTLREAMKSSLLQVYKYSDLERDCLNTRKYLQDTDINTTNYIGHTSGTSGSKPKPIPVTNKNGISTIEQLFGGNVNWYPKDRCLRVLPLFAPFGAYDNYIFNLSSGSNNLSVPEFKISEFGYLLKKYHPNIIIGTATWIAALPDCEYLQNEDLSCITRIIYGAEAMTVKDIERVNKWLRDRGCKVEATTGHGMSEFLGCGSYAQKEYNIPGSIGIPLPKTIYSIVDPNIEDKLVPLKFEEGKDLLSGELVVSSEAVTDGILHGEVIIPHYEMEGESYIRTRDIVSMNRDGVFFHEARKDRSFARIEGFKVKPYEIEKEIVKNSQVHQVIVVDYFDDRYRGYMPICHIVPIDESILVNEEAAVELVKDIVYNNIIANPQMQTRQIPSKFRFRASLPLTKNSKIDFNAIRSEGLDGTEINVDVDETNLSIKGIEIYPNKNKAKIKRK